MKTTTNQKENNKITQDEDLNQISQYLNIKTSSSKSLNPFELIHERFNSHSNLTSNQLHSISFNLTNYQNQLQLEFDSLHQQFINSQSDLLNSIQSTKTSLQTLKQQNEKTHESYLKSEDDLIDHFQNSNSIILTNTLSNQIQWLNQLQHLKVWYNLLLNVQKRSEEILKKTTKVEESIETLQNDLFEFFQHYSSFKFIEFETQSKLNLLDLIHQLIVHTIQTIIQTFSNELILSFEEELQWPLPIEQTLDLTTLSNSSRIFKAFKIICQFQTKLENFNQMINLSPKKPINLDYRMVWCPLPNLIAMKSIVKPLELRFRYHFDSQRSTNRLDKPEWYFDHILHRLEEHERFVRGDVQRLMDMNGYGHLDAMTQFSILLIEMIEKKLKQTIPQILEIKPLLAHTIYKAIEFDTSIKERGFQPIQSSDSSKDEAWLGTTEVILGNEEWFEVWFEAEKKFFEENGSEIMNSTDTWIIETEEPRVIEKGIKTTVSALKIEEQITEMKHRIERLSKIEYQLRFLIELQLKLIKEYHAKISNVLNAFESQFGHIGLIRSSVPVGGNENGEVGTLKLVKVYVSLEWMLGVFKEWSDDLYYVELFDEIKLRSSTMSWRLKKLIEEIGLDQNSESLFDPFIKLFEESFIKCEGLIIKDLLRLLSLELKPYFSKRWDLEPTTETEEISEDLSPELLKPLTIWKQTIKSIHELIHKRKRKVYTKISEEVSNLILNKIVLNGIGLRSITEEGGNQLRFDLFDGFLGCIKEDFKFTEIGWNKLIDAIKLLTLKSSLHQNDQKWNITKVCEVCFNEEKIEEFQMMKNEIGIGKSLSKEEVCAVLRRRPECWR